MTDEAGAVAERSALLIELVTRARRALASGDFDEITALMQRIEALGAGITQMIGADRRRQRQAVLALLDEAEGLTGELAAARDRGGAALRELAAHQLAETAYRRTGAR